MILKHHQSADYEVLVGPYSLIVQPLYGLEETNTKIAIAQGGRKIAVFRSRPRARAQRRGDKIAREWYRACHRFTAYEMALALEFFGPEVCRLLGTRKAEDPYYVCSPDLRETTSRFA